MKTIALVVFNVGNSCGLLQTAILRRDCPDQEANYTHTRWREPRFWEM